MSLHTKSNNHLCHSFYHCICATIKRVTLLCVCVWVCNVYVVLCHVMSVSATYNDKQWTQFQLKSNAFGKDKTGQIKMLCYYLNVCNASEIFSDVSICYLCCGLICCYSFLLHVCITSTSLYAIVQCTYVSLSPYFLAMFIRKYLF